MYILGIDTTTDFLAVGVAKNDRILATYHKIYTARHIDLLIPVIDRLLKRCKIQLADIDVIAVSTGPGSFAGLRIGVSTCKAINLALGTKIVSVPTLDVIAYNFAGNAEFLCPLIDAKKKKLYSCVYKVLGWKSTSLEAIRLKRVTPYILADIDYILDMVNTPVLVFGDGAGLYEKEIRKKKDIKVSAKPWHPRPEILIKLGYEKIKRRNFEKADKLIPMYMHSRYCQVIGMKDRKIVKQ